VPRFEQARGVGAVGLVAQDVRLDLRGRQQNRPVPEAHDRAAPEVGGAAGLHHDLDRLVQGQELQQLPTRQAPPLEDPAVRIGRQDLEDVLREVDGDRGSLVHDSSWLLNYRFMARRCRASY
jgi:hypothetical protein